MKNEIFALPQEHMDVDDKTYLVEAMPASVALEIQEELFKNDMQMDMKMIKRIVCGSVSYDGKMIDSKSFDIVFARKTAHVRKLVQKILEWNFEDSFLGEEGDTQD